VEALLILKFGGVLTHLGKDQAEFLGRNFRLKMYPRGNYYEGRSVQIEPMKPIFEAPGSVHLTLKCDGPLYEFGFNFILRRYSKAAWPTGCFDCTPRTATTSKYTLRTRGGCRSPRRRSPR
jgi:hypothetical protein